MKSVVFDNAGTIMKRCTVLKNMHNNNILFETNTIGLINDNPDNLILVLQTPISELIKNNNNISIKDHIINNYDKIEISYSNTHITKKKLIDIIKDNTTTISDIKEVSKILINKYSIEICSGVALIINIKTGLIEYVYVAGGVFFSETKHQIDLIQKKGYDVYLASGDNRHSLTKIGNLLNIPIENIYDTQDSYGKKNLVKKLQKRYSHVTMVGNNTNDMKALIQADKSILTIQQKEKLPPELYEVSSIIIEDIKELEKILI
ncbi:MAG: HAD family hydrolase [Methanobacteriaceae archaeon]|nr:HAD family hydrolase [Methanobacteriaceae archaeon]